MAKKGRSKGKSEPGGGGMMSMRSSMRRIVGAEKGAEKGPKKKVRPVWNVVSWVLVLAMVVAAGFLLYRRFGS